MSWWLQASPARPLPSSRLPQKIIYWSASTSLAFAALAACSPLPTHCLSLTQTLPSSRCQSSERSWSRRPWRGTSPASPASQAIKKSKDLIKYIVHKIVKKWAAKSHFCVLKQEWSRQVAHFCAALKKIQGNQYSNMGLLGRVVKGVCSWV